MDKKISWVAQFCKADSCETDITDNLINFLCFIVCCKQLCSIRQVESNRISLLWDRFRRHSKMKVLHRHCSWWAVSSVTRGKACFWNCRWMSCSVIWSNLIYQRWLIKQPHFPFKFYHLTTPPGGLTGRNFAVGAPWARLESLNNTNYQPPTHALVSVFTQVPNWDSSLANATESLAPNIRKYHSHRDFSSHSIVQRSDGVLNLAALP